ncbi:MAG: NINE protein [Nostocaceae cyanobacterium]|nr:NINE protein [Nostocaceae cyanobacterium]
MTQSNNINPNRLSNSYLLWAVWLLGLGGLHRLYNGKIVTGLLWCMTWGVFGLGQFVDLFLVPSMVEEHDLKLRARQGLSPLGIPYNQQAIASQVYHSPQEKLMMQLLKAAEAKGGKLTVTQGVMLTGASFSEVEAVLKDMLKSGYIRIDNDPISGAVTYHFNEL